MNVRETQGSPDRTRFYLHGGERRALSPVRRAPLPGPCPPPPACVRASPMCVLLYPVDPSFGHTLAPEPPALMTIPSECPWLAHGVQPRGPRVGTRRLQSSPAPGWPCQLRGDPEPPASVPQCRPCKMGSVARESQGPEKSQQGCVHRASGTYPALVADRRPLPASRSRALLRGRLSALLHPSCPGLSAQSARGRAAQGAAWCRARRQRPTPGA